MHLKIESSSSEGWTKNQSKTKSTSKNRIQSKTKSTSKNRIQSKNSRKGYSV
jgi:hypothetical protein